MKQKKTVPERGFTLLEVMIALVIFTSGLGAYALLMLKSVQEAGASLHRTVAVTQANALAEQLRLLSNPASASAASGPSGCLEGTRCSPGDMAAATLLQWKKRIARELPNGSGTVCLDSTPNDGDAAAAACDGSGGLVVKVFWHEPNTTPGVELSRRTTATVGLP